MKAPISYEEYQRLELIPSSDPRPVPEQKRLSRWWQAVLAYFDGSANLRVWQANHKGQTVWRVYDPVTRRRAEFTNEAELRVWLEARYYQPAYV